jgi:dTDP-4-dehydrorhamnose 3,5-epimerase
MTTVRKLALEGVVEILPKRFEDERGFFSETFNGPELARAGIDLSFVQDNHSLSRRRGVLRGLHYQLPPKAQDKLLRVVRGAIFDVAIDIRSNSPTFGRWTGVEVSAARWNQVLVPKGFAHGFLTLEDDTEVLYKVSAEYAPEHERAIRWDDPDIRIEWPLAGMSPVLSPRDATAPLLGEAETF